MDEKGFRVGISDHVKAICNRREKGMTGKFAMDGIHELITVIGCISGDDRVISPILFTSALLST